ncbi:MAG: nitroreductase [Methanobacteriota archaeon]|nr:MAG: nitroreductase [Euryarchaeota archaeon]
MLFNLIVKNRSYRRFDEGFRVDRDTLVELVNLARLSASAGNLQPLKYILSCEPEKNELIFPHLSWAGYLEDWKGPERGERPSAYIVVLGDTRITRHFGCDHGIASQSILLGAVEKGLGGCIIGTIDREELRKTLKIPEYYEILLVIALGKPKEKVVIEEAVDNIKYWRDEKGVHHVPKRPLKEIIVS